MINLAKRNLYYTVRDRVAFIMSFLSVIITIAVYKAFLGSFQIDAIKAATHLSTVPVSGVQMVNYWLVGGITVVTSVTSVVGALGVLVDDQESGKILDFQLTGTTLGRIFISYYVSGLALGFVITFLSLIIGLIIFVGGVGLSAFSLINWMQMIGFILLFNGLSLLLAMPVIRMIKTRSGFTVFSTIIGTLIGFFAGVYISVGNVGTTVRNLMLSLPFVHEATLLKAILMQKSKDTFFQSYPDTARESYDKLYGNQLYFTNGTKISQVQSVSFVVLWLVVLLLINIIVQWHLARRK